MQVRNGANDRIMYWTIRIRNVAEDKVFVQAANYK
jgi:hypothetical protein